jgi:dihydroorotase
MKKILIKNVRLVNEGRVDECDVLISGQRIEKIAQGIPADGKHVVEGNGMHLLPGLIDDQVHFREPGLTHKANIFSESRAAVAGGITSYMDMPNTIPNTLSLELLEEKYAMAAQHSLANYSFFMGLTQTNLEEALRIDNTKVCGITDDGLYFNDSKGILANYPEFLEQVFSRSNSLVALHCEDDARIAERTELFKQQYGNDIPMECHAEIRDAEACYLATQRATEIARKHNARLHVYHVSSAKELDLFDNHIPVRQKRITAEACVHHLWFTHQDYDRLGAGIKWNPSVKYNSDREALLRGLQFDILDIIATDHAPHTWAEKQGNYFQALSGGPLVQHALPVLLELYWKGEISLEKIVEKTSHHVAELYRIKDRGYIREGYFADLVLVDLYAPWRVLESNVKYRCRWSPFMNQVFRGAVMCTWVNGEMVYKNGEFQDLRMGMRLEFEKER